MPRTILDSGIELEYETFGSSDDPTLLLVMGFTAQLTAWDTGLCRMFADRGLHVVRFDNRDCGLSTWMGDAVADPSAVMAAVLSGTELPPVPYDLSDMASDAIGLLDHLGVATAHVMGVSMGGMIVQTMAIEHPARVASMTSVMSMPGDLDVGRPTPEALQALLAPPPLERDDFIEAASRSLVWASKRYADLERLRANAARDYDRAFNPAGGPRQLAAIYASGDRSEALRQLQTPTLVVHGRDDTLIDPSGGLRTVELVPGAHLLMLADMGHDMPEPLWPTIVGAVAGHVFANDPAAAVAASD
ncbi:MAG: alpha/beta hydrolase [Ilumatobacter sp.]|nr:MAG: alpha/beta hydrolase [Ilumatobacter sp.]